MISYEVEFPTQKSVSFKINGYFIDSIASHIKY